MKSFLHLTDAYRCLQMLTALSRRQSSELLMQICRMLMQGRVDLIRELVEKAYGSQCCFGGEAAEEMHGSLKKWMLMLMAC